MATAPTGFRLKARQGGIAAIAGVVAINITPAGQVSDGAAPLTLEFDQATPHMISVRMLQSRSLASGTTAKAYYRVTGASTWINSGGNHSGELYRVLASEGALSGLDGFAGPIIDVQPNTGYDVKVDIVEPSVGSWTLTTTHATRALPTENPAPTGSGSAKSATTSNWTTVLAGAVAGDVITLSNGSYSTAGITFNSPGTLSNPVFIRGQSREGVQITCTANSGSFDILMSLTGSNCVIENITFIGKGTDGGTSAASQCLSWSGGSTMSKQNWTIRHCTFSGFDRGVKTYEPIAGTLIYDCEFLGNNATSLIQTGDATGQGWNDDGCDISGHGNCVWECTFSGHGDVVKMGLGGSQSGFADAYRSRACYVMRNWVKWSADDGCEFDEACGNVAMWDNVIENTTTAFSADGIYGGPIVVARNAFINPARHPLKLTSFSQGVRIYNNAFIEATKLSGHDYAILIPTGGWPSYANYGLDLKNNIISYRGTSGALVHANSSTALPNFDASNNGWWTDGTIQWATAGPVATGSYANLAAAKTGLSPIMRNDFVMSSANPFASTITLGSDYSTTYTGHFDTTIASGDSAKNAGVAIPGITDGFSGAAPDIGPVIEGRFWGQIGCSWDRAIVPNYANTQTTNAWAQLSGTAISTVDPTVPPDTATGSVNGKVTPWNSNSIDERYSRFYNAATGGHTDYAGNEVDVLELEQHAPAWRELRTCTVTVANGSYYSDGRPTSRHTYLGQHFNALTNRIMQFGGAQFSSGAILTTVDAFSLDANDWDASGTYPNIPSAVSSVEYKPMCLDPRTGDVYVLADNGSGVRYIASSGTWSSSFSVTVDRSASLVWDTRRNVITQINGNTLRRFDPPANSSQQNLTITGVTIPTSNNADFQGSATVYVRKHDACYHYVGNSGGGTVYKIDMETLVATDLGTTGGSSIPSPGHGPQQRFRFAPNIGGVIFQADRTACWFLKLY